VLRHVVANYPQERRTRRPTPLRPRGIRPPSVVESVQAAVRWLAGAIIDLDREAADTPAALADGLGHLLTICVFADVAKRGATTLRAIAPGLLCPEPAARTLSAK